jgi:hypothetical protein
MAHRTSSRTKKVVSQQGGLSQEQVCRNIERIVNIKSMATKPLFVSGWQVAGIRNGREFFSTLNEILPLPVNLRFEGTRISADIQVVLASIAIAPSIQIPPGTICPNPTVFHVRATGQFLSQLAAVSGKNAVPKVCDHFHAYSDSRGLMQWYDAFNLPLLIDESIPELSLQRFCRGLGVQYARWQSPIRSSTTQRS